MEKIEKRDYRTYIKIWHNSGKNATTIFNELNEGLGVDTPSYPTVARWVASFENGRQNVEDMHRSGRPITKLNQVNIDKVRYVIEEDPYCTYDKIEAETSLSRGTIERIIHDVLQMRKITSRWVPHQLSE